MAHTWEQTPWLNSIDAWREGPAQSGLQNPHKHLSCCPSDRSKQRLLAGSNLLPNTSFTFSPFPFPYFNAAYPCLDYLLRDAVQ